MFRFLNEADLDPEMSSGFNLNCTFFRIKISWKRKTLHLKHGFIFSFIVYLFYFCPTVDYHNLISLDDRLLTILKFAPASLKPVLSRLSFPLPIFNLKVSMWKKINFFPFGKYSWMNSGTVNINVNRKWNEISWLHVERDPAEISTWIFKLCTNFRHHGNY